MSQAGPAAPASGRAATRAAPGPVAQAALPAALVLAAAVSVQFGAGIASKLFAQVPPASVTTLRLWAAAGVMIAIGGRGAVRELRAVAARRAWGDAVATGAFGVVLAVMNFAIYQSFARIPLGIAVTTEFLGPLVVAIAGARRRASVAWVVLAAAGVLLLAGGSGGHLNRAGAGWALVAGAGWASYILLSKAIGQRLAGSSGLVVAMTVAAAVVTGPGVAAGGKAIFRPSLLRDGLALGVLSSALPYWLELEALRRVPARVFGVWMSLQPAVAAIIGLLMLGQRLSAAEWAGIGCVVIASAGAARSSSAASDRATARDDARGTGAGGRRA